MASSSSSSSSSRKRIRNEEDNNDYSTDKRQVVGHGGTIIYKNPRSMAIQKNTNCLLAALNGQYVNIELKNDSEVYGKIDAVDSRMNIEMTDVKLITSKSLSPSYHEIYSLNGNAIRYVHIPRSVDIKESVKLFSMSIQQKKVGNITRMKEMERIKLNTSQSSDIFIQSHNK